MSAAHGPWDPSFVGMTALVWVHLEIFTTEFTEAHRVSQRQTTPWTSVKMSVPSVVK
jgi:hypothetical protein